MLRYRVEETDDGLSGEEGTFTICSFWLVSALVEIGEVSRAKRLCERLLSFASPLHLYAEEIQPRTGRHLGNFPQAFTHLALINAVVHVIRAEDESEVRRVPTRQRAGVAEDVVLRRCERRTWRWRGRPHAGPIQRRRYARSSALERGGSGGAMTIDWMVRSRNSTSSSMVASS